MKAAPFSIGGHVGSLLQMGREEKEKGGGTGKVKGHVLSVKDGTRARRWTLPGLEYTGHGVACSGATGRAAFVPQTALNVIRIHKCGFGTLKTVSSLGLAFYVHDLVKGNSRWIVIRIRIKRPGAKQTERKIADGSQIELV
ncbi:hypothetical protein D5086_002856 [Populus alba]|uniref:Uncharacterized protein n=1 Tax=Populus alba TaxID=43335 RepID=A0ACC4D2Q8_POPAL